MGMGSWSMGEMVLGLMGEARLLVPSLCSPKKNMAFAIGTVNKLEEF